MGYELRYNPALLFDDREEFVRFMNADQPVRPANLATIVAMNQGKRSVPLEEPRAEPLSPAEVDAHLKKGAIVVDGRSESAFGSGHICGAYNVQQSSPEFEQRVGWITPLDAPTVIVAETDADAQRAVHALSFVGLHTRVVGFLRGGIRSWIASGRAVATIPQTSVHDLEARLRRGDEMNVLDVREISEWSTGHVEGARHMSFKVLGDHLDELGLDPASPLSVVCAGGLRSSTACSILLRNGYSDLHNVTGGMGAWKAAGLPVTG